MIDSKKRFSDKVDNYVKFRPTYPAKTIELIIQKSNIDQSSAIADIGAGTGKFTKLLLEQDLQVSAVEPNGNMRGAAEAELSAYSNFTSINGSAEQTGLPDNSIDLITVAQAFHWFDHDKCKIEFGRVLKPGGHVALIWNRRDKRSAFMAEYEQIIKRLHNEYPNLTHDKMTAYVFNAFFKNHETFNICWKQPCDFTSLWGRAQSSSYAPAPGHPNHLPLRDALWALFEKHQQDGKVDFEYETELIIGSL